MALAAEAVYNKATPDAAAAGKFPFPRMGSSMKDTSNGTAAGSEGSKSSHAKMNGVRAVSRRGRGDPDAAPPMFGRVTGLVKLGIGMAIVAGVAAAIGPDVVRRIERENAAVDQQEETAKAAPARTERRERVNRPEDVALRTEKPALKEDTLPVTPAAQTSDDANKNDDPEPEKPADTADKKPDIENPENKKPEDPVRPVDQTADARPSAGSDPVSVLRDRIENAVRRKNEVYAMTLFNGQKVRAQLVGAKDGRINIRIFKLDNLESSVPWTAVSEADLAVCAQPVVEVSDGEGLMALLTVAHARNSDEIARGAFDRIVRLSDEQMIARARAVLANHVAAADPAVKPDTSTQNTGTVMTQITNTNGPPKRRGKGMWSDLVPARSGREFYVAPNGGPGGNGSKSSPWDIESALGGKHPVPPGSVIWVGAGTYKHPDRNGGGYYKLGLKGAKGAPIHVRGEPGARVMIDGGIAVSRPVENVWIWDLEVTVSEWWNKIPETSQSGSSGGGISGGPVGGLDINSCNDCKFINLDVHHARGTGVNFWIGAVDTELHGLIIYGNGWHGPDRGHGHCIYSQNKEGTKEISGCIMSAKIGGQLTLQAYGSERAFVDNYLVTDNIAFERGMFLIGGGQSSHNVRILRNYAHDLTIQVGYNAPENEDCEVKDNIVVNGRLNIKSFKKKVESGNIIGQKISRGILIPNKYDTGRANIAAFGGGSVSVNVSGFMEPGESYRLMDPHDFYGKPVQEGKCAGGSISVPVKGEFSAWVLLRDGK
jgi:hypothetical protein